MIYEGNFAEMVRKVSRLVYSWPPFPNIQSGYGWKFGMIHELDTGVLHRCRCCCSVGQRFCHAPRALRAVHSGGAGRPPVGVRLDRQRDNRLDIRQEEVTGMGDSISVAFVKLVLKVLAIVAAVFLVFVAVIFGLARKL